MNSTNTTSPANAYPSWLPSGFKITASATCPTASKTLAHFALYNAISIASFLLLRNIYFQNLLSCNSVKTLKPWRWFSPVGKLAFQIGGQVATAYLARGRSGKTNAWQIIQLWALRPRTTWFVGNLAQLRRRWGYTNAALSSIFCEVMVCSLGCVFVGRIVQAASTNPPGTGEPRKWYEVMLYTGFVMLVSVGLEIVWVVYIAVRVLQVGGRPEADDMDRLKWIARTVVPVTCMCSWLIWAAYLNASEGSYCPANVKYIDLVWGVVPVVSDLFNSITETYL